MSEQPGMSQEMLDLQKQMNELRTLMVEFTQGQDEIKRDIREHETAIRQLTVKYDEINGRIFDARRALRNIESDMIRQQKADEQKAVNEAAQREFNRLADELDAIAADAVWQGKAMAHQISGAKRLAIGERVLLADKMGLGKTLTLFMACDYNRAKRVLYVTTADLVENVIEESRIWAPQRGAFTISGLPKTQRDIILKHLKGSEEFFMVINYEAWRKDKELLEALTLLQFDTVIVDEAHKMKNIKSANYQGIRKIVMAKNQCPTCSGPVIHYTDSYNYTRVKCAAGCDTQHLEEEALKRLGTAQQVYCSTRFFYPATGTFILNRPQEIFASLSLVSPRRFSRLNDFLSNYCQQDWNTGKWRFKSGGVESLMKAIEGNIVARDLKSAGIKLPPQKVIFHNLKLDPTLYPAQHKVISDLREFNAIDLADEKIGIFHMLALITRERQAITWPAGMRFASIDNSQVWNCEVAESVKIDAILHYDSNEESWDGILADATANGERNENGEWTGDRVVVFSQFKQPLIEIERRCREAGIDVVRLDGDTTEMTHAEIRKDFNRKTFVENPGYEAKWQVVLANYKSGGVGLNFTDCTQTIILDEEWNPGSRDQAYARTYRIGQIEETTVHVLRVENSIDTWMATLMEQKEKIVAGFEDDIEMMTALRDILEKSVA